MTDLSIRRFEPADCEAVRELNERAMTTTPEWVPDAPDEDLQDVERHYLDTGGEFLVDVRDGEIVAMAAFEPLEGWMVEEFGAAEQPGVSTVELSRMRVDPDCWGRGYATRLYEAPESRARETGHDAFVLNTGVDNDRARGFHESRGFDPVDEVTVDFEDL